MMPFWLKDLICYLFGHIWQKVPDVQSWDPYQHIWRPSRYCSRCHKTE